MDEDLEIGEQIKKLLDEKRQQIKTLEKGKDQLLKDNAFTFLQLRYYLRMLKKQVEKLETLSKLSSVEALQRILEENL